MKIGRTLGILTDILIICVVIGSYFIHRILGYILTLLWLFGGAGFAGIMFRELDWDDPAPEPRKAKLSPYVDLIGSKTETISELKPYGFVSLNGDRVNAKSLVGFLPQGTPVIITDAVGNSVFVEELIIGHNHGLESTSAPPAAGTPETHP